MILKLISESAALTFPNTLCPFLAFQTAGFSWHRTCKGTFNPMASGPICCGEQTLLSFPSQRFLHLLCGLCSILSNPSGLACWDQFPWSQAIFPTLFSTPSIWPFALSKQGKFIPAAALAVESRRKSVFLYKWYPVHDPTMKWVGSALSCWLIFSQRDLQATFLSAMEPSLFFFTTSCFF